MTPVDIRVGTMVTRTMCMFQLMSPSSNPVSLKHVHMPNGERGCFF